MTAETAEQATRNAVTLDEAARVILSGRNLAHVGTASPDGAPHVTPVWIDIEGDHLLLNTAEDRRKKRNLRSDPRITVSVADRDNPFAVVVIQGRAVDP